jgi:hypothetical protein
VSNHIAENVPDAFTSRRGFKPFAIGLPGGFDIAPGNGTSECLFSGEDGTLLVKFRPDINNELVGRPCGGILCHIYGKFGTRLTIVKD